MNGNGKLCQFGRRRNIERRVEKSKEQMYWVLAVHDSLCTGATNTFTVYVTPRHYCMNFTDKLLASVNCRLAT